MPYAASAGFNIDTHDELNVLLSTGIELVPHSWLTHLLTGYSLQLIATLPRARFVEFNVSQSALTRGIASARFVLEADGTIAIPDSVDMGVHVDEDFIAAHRVN